MKKLSSFPFTFPSPSFSRFLSSFFLPLSFNCNDDTVILSRPSLITNDDEDYYCYGIQLLSGVDIQRDDLEVIATRIVLTRENERKQTRTRIVTKSFPLSRCFLPASFPPFRSSIISHILECLPLF